MSWPLLLSPSAFQADLNENLQIMHQRRKVVQVSLDSGRNNICVLFILSMLTFTFREEAALKGMEKRRGVGRVGWMVGVRRLVLRDRWTSCRALWIRCAFICETLLFHSIGSTNRNGAAFNAISLHVCYKFRWLFSLFVTVVILVFEKKKRYIYNLIGHPHDYS